MTTESQRYNCFTRNGGNAIPKHAGPEAKGSDPTSGLTLLWASNPFWGNFNHWQVSQKEAGKIFYFFLFGYFVVLLWTVVTHYCRQVDIWYSFFFNFLVK